MRKLSVIWILALLVSVTLGSAVLLTSPGLAEVEFRGLPIVLEFNFWNVRSYNGNALLKFDGEKVLFEADLYDIVQVDPNSWVHGYPEIYYGYKPWSGKGVSSDVLKLPRKVNDLPDFHVVLEYSLWHEERLPFNLAVESWITREERPRAVTVGDVEMMIWLYNSILTPGGDRVGTLQVEMEVNGEVVETLWEVYYAEWGWDYLAFRLTTPLREGKVVLPVKPFVEKTKEVIREFSKMKRVSNFDEMYFENVEVGTEFGDPRTKESRFGWEIREFSILVK